MAHPAFAFRTPVVETIETVLTLDPKVAPPLCPVCHLSSSSGKTLERFQQFALHECTGCSLQFWEPRPKSDSFASSTVATDCTQRLLPLEPGHRFFLSDLLAPRCGRLLDVGCGTGGFLIAASLAGYTASGIEKHPEAAQLAARHCPRARIFPIQMESFRSHFPDEIFDVVTMFGSLQHQPHPSSFLSQVRACLRPRGFVALSVPNRNCWQTAARVSERPPNHVLRWNPESLRAALRRHGFSVMSMRSEKPTLTYTAQQIYSLLRSPARGARPGHRIATHENPESKTEHHAPISFVDRVLRSLDRIKYAASLPLAAATMPLVRWRGYTGPHLYCLARKLD